MVAAAGIHASPLASANPTETLAAAVNAAREVSCQPLRADPVVQRVAEEVNDSTDRWLNHAARAVPVPDATPLLKDLGYGGDKSVILQGAGSTLGEATKAALLQGYVAIADCSYVNVGVSSLHNMSKNMILTVVVLAA
jgi:hypothetical protein